MPPNSPFPTSPFTTAFDALVAVLKEDELLGRAGAVKTWRVWDGDADVDRSSPDPRQMPWLRITPNLSAINLDEVNDYKTDFVVGFEMALPGVNLRHSLDFWFAIMRALVYEKPHRDRTVREFLRDNEIATYRFIRPAVAPVVDPDGFQTARGAVNLMVRIPT